MGKCEGLRVLGKKIFGVDEGDEPWVETLLGNGCFISITNMTRFIRVGITHREGVM